MHDTLKKFDWDFCKEVKDPRIYDYLKANHATFVCEEAFVTFISSLSRDGISHASRKFSPSSARSEYRRLKNNFGFFTG